KDTFRRVMAFLLGFIKREKQAESLGNYLSIYLICFLSSLISYSPELAMFVSPYSREAVCANCKLHICSPAARFGILHGTTRSTYGKSCEAIARFIAVVQRCTRRRRRV